MQLVQCGCMKQDEKSWTEVFAGKKYREDFCVFPVRAKEGSLMVKRYVEWNAITHSFVLLPAFVLFYK